MFVRFARTANHQLPGGRQARTGRLPDGEYPSGAAFEARVRLASCRGRCPSRPAGRGPRLRSRTRPPPRDDRRALVRQPLSWRPPCRLCASRDRPPPRTKAEVGARLGRAIACSPDQQWPLFPQSAHAPVLRAARSRGGFTARRPARRPLKPVPSSDRISLALIERAGRGALVLPGWAVTSRVGARVPVVAARRDRGARDPAGCKHHACRQKRNAPLHAYLSLLLGRLPASDGAYGEVGVRQ